jgi:hypothetical protein
MLVVALCMLCAAPALASHSAEPVVVRVSSYNLATRTYTFSCAIPPTASQQRYWTVRPDTQALEAEFHTTSPTLTYVLDKDVMYHIGCQVQNGSTTIRGDFHIDWRSGPNTAKPNVRALSTNGLQVTLQCTPPSGTTNYNLYWTLLNPREGISLTQFNNQNTITTSVPYPLLWDIDCGVWDKDKNAWTQWGLPVEFFSQGPAYVPTKDGCVPGDPCPQNQSAPSNGTSPPNATNGTSCFSNVQSIPASCAGGIIIQDDYNRRGDSCRYTTCSNNGVESMSVKACNKPDGQAPQYFEMYRQASTGSGVKICLGASCMQNEGYVRSPNFPICTNATGAPGPTNGTVDLSVAPPFPQGRTFRFLCDANVSFPIHTYRWMVGEGSEILTEKPELYHTYYTAEGQKTVTCTAANFDATKTASDALQITVSNDTADACVGTVEDMPVSCTQGVVYADALDDGGCRVVSCITEFSPRALFLRARACDLNSSAFEVVRLEQTSYPGMLCAGSTCVSASTERTKGGLPFCSAATGVDLNVAQWYPQGRDYVFVCEASGFATPSYDWFFGDGSKQLGTGNKDVFHRYAAAGNYNVLCTAKDATHALSDTLSIAVS